MTLAEYLSRVQHPVHGQRRGQYAWNLLADKRPELTKELFRRYDLDPFYDDELFPAFLAWVEEHW